MTRARRKAHASAPSGAAATDTPFVGESVSLWERVRSALSREEWLMLVGVWLGSRLVLLLLASILGGLIPSQEPMSVIDRFSRWDSGWYVNILENGYQLREPGQQSNVAFFPLYPILGWMASLLFLGNLRWGLWLVSNLSLLVALIYLYRLAKLEMDAESGQRSILYLSLYPFAVFLSALYTESLFLAIAAAAFFYARQGRWPLAVAIGALLPVTRLPGLAIIPALAIEWWRSQPPAKRTGREALLLLGLPVLFVLHMLFLWVRVGDPLAFITIQSTWDRVVTYPWGTLGVGLQVLGTVPDTRYIKAIAWLDMASIALAVGLLPLIWRRLGASYAVFGIIILIAATSTSLDPAKGLPTASIGRYIMTIFPIFLILGQLGARRWLHHPILALFAGLFGPVALYFFASIWVG